MSPSEKIELIQGIQKAILKEVDLYYEHQTPALLPYTKMLESIPEVNKSKLVLDADQLLLISVWVLCQAKDALTRLYSSLSLIYEFSTDSQKLSQAGYSVTSLEVCLESMLKEDEE